MAEEREETNKNRTEKYLQNLSAKRKANPEKFSSNLKAFVTKYGWRAAFGKYNHNTLFEELGISSYRNLIILPQKQEVEEEIQRESEQNKLTEENRAKLEQLRGDLESLNTQLLEEGALRKQINQNIRNLERRQKENWNRDPTQPGPTFPKKATVRQRPHRNLASIGIPGGKHMQPGEPLAAIGSKKPKQDRKTRRRRSTRRGSKN